MRWEKNRKSLWKKSCFFLGVVCGLGGCAINPSSIVDQPMTARPVPAVALNNANPGGIYQSGAYRPLFEDVRARAVGDSIIISISENTKGSTSSGNATSKSSATKFAAPNLFGATAATTDRLNLSTATSNSLSEKGSGSVANTFSGTIAVTITEVLANGNFKVSGEKKLGFDRQTEYIRFSGVVSPSTIVAGNTVASTQVADAKFEYRTNAHIDSSEMMSILDRFFLSFIPL